MNDLTSLPTGTGGAVFRQGGQPITTSKIIADYFGKQHKHVLRDIDRIIKTDAACAPNFGPTSLEIAMPNGGTRSVRGYTLNSRAFALLVMGFTGAEALRWKVKFLDAFDRLAERERDNYREAIANFTPSASARRRKKKRILSYDPPEQLR